MPATPEPPSPAPGLADPRVGELFGVPPGEFVTRRDQLVRELRRAGDTAAAGEVKLMRRPTAAAWAVNQLAAGHRERLLELLALGERLRGAHEALLEGSGTGAIRDVTAEQRRLVAQLTDIAVGFLGKAGEAQREAIGHTLDAAVADRDLGELVRAGRLTKELPAPSGFGALDLIFPPAPTAPAPELPDGERAADAERERAELLRQELEQREREARLERLHAEAERRGAEAASAAHRAAALHQELEELTARLEQARRRADAAADAAERALAELRRAETGG